MHLIRIIAKWRLPAIVTEARSSKSIDFLCDQLCITLWYDARDILGKFNGKHALTKCNNAQCHLKTSIMKRFSLKIQVYGFYYQNDNNVCYNAYKRIIFRSSWVLLQLKTNGKLTNRDFCVLFVVL